MFVHAHGTVAGNIVDGSQGEHAGEVMGAAKRAEGFQPAFHPRVAVDDKKILFEQSFREAQGASGAEGIGFAGDGDRGVLEAAIGEGGFDLFGEVSRGEKETGCALSAVIVEEVFEERFARDKRQALRPVGDDRPQASSQSSTQNNHLHAVGTLFIRWAKSTSKTNLARSQRVVNGLGEGGKGGDAVPVEKVEPAGTFLGTGAFKEGEGGDACIVPRLDVTLIVANHKAEPGVEGVAGDTFVDIAGRGFAIAIGHVGTLDGNLHAFEPDGKGEQFEHTPVAGFGVLQCEITPRDARLIGMQVEGEAGVEGVDQRGAHAGKKFHVFGVGEIRDVFDERPITIKKECASGHVEILSMNNMQASKVLKNLDAIKYPECCRRMKSLLHVVSMACAMVCVTQGVRAGGPAFPPPPVGLYLLNDRQVPVERMQVPSFISGFALRIAWKDLEPTKGNYDFAVLKRTITYLQAHDMKLTLEIFASMPPDYVLAEAKSRIQVRKGQAPAPWDAGAMERWRAFFMALSAYPVRDAVAQKDVPLRDHPTLTAVDAPILGLQSVRDMRKDVVGHPEYDRKRFVDAVEASVKINREAFPNDYGFLGFFRMEDGKRQPALDEEIFARVQKAFMQPGQPGLGLFQELWSDEGPNPGTLGRYLKQVKEPSVVMLQSLTSWKRPFTDAGKVASGNPEAALARANQQYGCRYFELYSADVRDPGLRSVFEAWAVKLDPEGSAKRGVPAKK